MKALVHLGLVLIGFVLGAMVPLHGARNQPANAAAPSTERASTAPTEVTATSIVPEGNNGIARKYRCDVGIASDPAVIFADDFESYARPDDLGNCWDSVYQKQCVGIATAPANVVRGRKSLEFTLPQQAAELSDAVDKMLKPERHILFLRYYSKYESPYDVVGSSHNGASISAHYYRDGEATPGVPANGRNKFLVLVADFMHLRFRHVENLKLDHFGLCFHIKSDPNSASRKWYDNVVAATSYIGPLAP